MFQLFRGVIVQKIKCANIGSFTSCIHCLSWTEKYRETAFGTMGHTKLKYILG